MPFLNNVQQWADQRPQATAVVVGGQRLSWAELRDAASRAVPDLPHLTVLAEPNSVDFVIRFSAALADERCCAVLDPTWGHLLLGELRQRLAEYSTGLPAGGVALVDGPLDSMFLVGLTSGTTSVPKAFTRSRASWRESFEASIAFFGLRQDDVTLAPGPLASSLNLYALSECLYAGAEFQSLESFDVGAVHEAITYDGVTRLVLVPTMLRLLSERGLAGSVDASGLRSIICAGSKLDARTLEAARRWAPLATIHEYYGASELSFVSGTSLQPGDPIPAGSSSIGEPFPGVEVRVLDDRAGVLPDGEVGNICVRSAMISNGYLWGDDGEALRFLDGWFTVGDQGFRATDGLHILGRRSDMILTSGRNVYPHEVELALAAIPGVAEALAVGVPDDVRGERVVAGVVLSHGGLSATQLRNGLDQVLQRSKWPVRFYVVDHLPTTDRGKPSRELLRDWIVGGTARVLP